MTSWGETADTFGRGLVPGITIFLFSILSLVPVPLENYGSVAPVLALAAAYCWTVWRPHTVPYVIPFLVGVVEDALRGTPLGVSALAYLLMVGFVRGQQRVLVTQRIEILWGVFAFCAVIYGLVIWGAISVMQGRAMPVVGIAIQVAVTAGIFPLVNWLLQRLHRRIYPEV